MTTPDLQRRRWKLEGGMYDGITVKPGRNDDPIIGLSIFPDKIEVLGDRGLATYRLEDQDGEQRAIAEGD